MVSTRPLVLTGGAGPGTMRVVSAPALRFFPLTPARWRDVEALFGPRGACAGCWCMWWRLPRSAWRRGKGAGNKRAFKRLVAAGRVPGVLAYAGREPVGWCAVAPREAYPVLARSRILQPVDDRPVWSVTCLFVARLRFSRCQSGLSVPPVPAAALLKVTDCDLRAPCAWWYWHREGGGAGERCISPLGRAGSFG